MKKKLFIFVILLFAFIVLGMLNAVNAEGPVVLTNEMFTAAKATPDTEVGVLKYEYSDMFYDYIYSLAPGDYVLGEDINFAEEVIVFCDNGNYTLNLDEKTLSGDIIARNATVIIDGEGTVKYTIRTFNNSNVTIKNGTFEGYLEIESSKVLIEYANINSNWSNAIQLSNDAELEILDGSFNSGEYANALRVEALQVKSLIIKGGIFTGGKHGFRSDTNKFNTVSLQGGTFIGSESAIRVDTESEEEANNALMNLLADGYVYLPEISTEIDEFDDGTDYVYIANASLKETSVVKIATYKVTFDANGGTGEMDEVTGLKGTYTLPENEFSAPSGKQFKGWSLTSDGDLVTTLEMTDNKVVYAIWEDIQEETVTPSDENKTPEETVTSSSENETLEETVTQSSENKTPGENEDGITTNNPITGDNIILWISLALVSIIGIVGTMKLTRKG